MTDFSIEDTHPGKIIAGVDEVGRGPLAGPVVTAAVIVDRAVVIEGIKDSKKLSKKKREELFEKISLHYKCSVGIISPAEIDRINILEATKKACQMAVRSLEIEPDIVLVDGNMKFSDERFCSIIKGDDKSVSIAAASIIAKVTRDRMMEELGVEFPEYKWAQNSGYGTKDHIDAIIKHGATPHHRRSFRVRGFNYS
ncbi:MAG: ribonuclease HII [Rickettsiales bacterium]|nr:MAG: ribonuclease HII [Rickettsiales bacterium]